MGRKINASHVRNAARDESAPQCSTARTLSTQSRRRRCYCPCPTLYHLDPGKLLLSPVLGVTRHRCLFVNTATGELRRRRRGRRQLEPFIKAPHANCANPFKGKAGSRRSTRFSHQQPNAAAVSLPPSLSLSCSLSARLNTQTVDEATCLENNLKAQKVSKATRIGTYPLPLPLFPVPLRERLSLPPSTAAWHSKQLAAQQNGVKIPQQKPASHFCLVSVSVLLFWFFVFRVCFKNL